MASIFHALFWRSIDIIMKNMRRRFDIVEQTIYNIIRYIQERKKQDYIIVPAEKR